MSTKEKIVSEIGRRYNILVVDDDKNIARLIETTLKKEKAYDINCVSNGEAGLKYYRENLPDLVLLDIQMPGIDGIETLKRMKDYESRIPVVIMSAHGSIEKAVQSMRIGAHDYMEKPFKGS